MHAPSNRFVVVISALLTLLVLGGATLAVGFRNGWLHVGADGSSREAVMALAQLTDSERSRAVPAARAAGPSQSLEAADQSEVAVYTQKLEEAYRALDDAYARIRSLQTAQSQVASHEAGDRRFTGYDDDRHRERGSRQRESDDD